MSTFDPGGTRSVTTSAVIIFVSEAIGSTRVGARRHSTRPVSMSNISPARGWCLKRTWTGSRGSSSRTASGDSAVPPPASGAVPASWIGATAPGPDGAFTDCLGASPPPGRRISTSAAATPTRTNTASTAGPRRRRRLRPPWKSVYGISAGGAAAAR